MFPERDLFVPFLVQKTQDASQWNTASQTYCFCFPRSFVLLISIVLHQLCLLHQVGTTFSFSSNTWPYTSVCCDFSFRLAEIQYLTSRFNASFSCPGQIRRHASEDLVNEIRHANARQVSNNGQLAPKSVSHFTSHAAKQVVQLFRDSSGLPAFYT